MTPILRKWMIGAEPLTKAEEEVVDYANRANRVALRERLVACQGVMLDATDAQVRLFEGANL
ncbi:hypothetical protein GA830_10315 [Mesorhizobium sp. NBSH29]|uniref:hypothetical protein n=1 Tax=Mesorhizobium sp. NBSH29 TaxID=2654249 RepID=UPI001896A0A9|nr:hypothetical protein [Mesorhizobium sp. NBSH29]QPC87089.1 hypothetical protein GA830_10315 [Mesorhizobium sp. NBSH29]